jgi:glycosyltransferase involved in cell wall biosynthesis
MDADLQHNPSYIPSLVNPIINGEADFSVGSRHTEGGGIENWAFHRKLISWGATLIARPLVPCTDPMSGFFALSKNTLGRAKVLNPLGYKIGLELMVRCDVQKIQEVPIIFKDRTLGVSKLNIKTNALYLLHVSQLYLDCKPHYVFVVGLCLLILILFIGKRALFTADNHLRYTNTNGDGQRSVATQRDITSIATTSANDRAWDNSKPSSSSSASSLDKPPLPEQQQTNNQHTHKPKTKKLD